MSIEVVDAQALVARLETRRAALENGAALLAFDADGTLWTGDVGIDLFEALLAVNGIRDAARDALAAEAHACGIADEGDAMTVARSLYAGFAEDRWPHERAFAAMAWAFAGWTASEVEAFAREVVHATELAARVRASTRTVLAWAVSHDIEVWAVSASPRAVVVLGVEGLGIPPDHVLAMTPAVEVGVLLPRLALPPVYGDGKLAALRRERPNAKILGAFGDSGYDAAMLRAADIAVAVAPAPSLAALLSTIPGVVVLRE